MKLRVKVPAWLPLMPALPRTSTVAATSSRLTLYRLATPVAALNDWMTSLNEAEVLDATVAVTSPTCLKFWANWMGSFDLRLNTSIVLIRSFAASDRSVSPMIAALAAVGMSWRPSWASTPACAMLRSACAASLVE